MSTVFECEGVRHWVSHTAHTSTLEGSVKTVAYAYCHTRRVFPRDLVLVFDAVPTCLLCLVKHDLFKAAEAVMRAAGGDGGLERFHRIHYGEHGVPAR